MLHTAILISSGVIKNSKWGCCTTLVIGLNGPGNSSWVYLFWSTYPSDKCISACKAHLFEKKGEKHSFTRHEGLKQPCFRHTFSSSGNSFYQIQIATNLLCTIFYYYFFEEQNLENILERIGKGLFKDNYKKKLAHFRHLMQHRNINGTSW